MPEYLAPGVYVEEFEIGSKPIEGVSTSTLGFLGETERGPTEPKLVTSWLEYQRKFGSFFGDDKYLPYAVEGFFLNGGKRGYVARIVDRQGATPATTTAGSIIINAVGEGAWGNRVAVKVLKATVEPQGFRLQIHYWKQLPDALFDPVQDRTTQPRPAYSEDFDDLVLNEKSPNYFDKRVNNGVSALVELEKDPGSDDVPAAADIKFLEDGADGDPVTVDDFDGRDEAGKRTGLNAFNEPRYEDIAVIYAPDAFTIGDALADKLMSHCENNKYRFSILDAKPGQADIGSVDPRSSRPSQYAAFYYPWIRIFDADTGARKLVPPGGHVAGIYARSDGERGVYKAPANEVVRGVLELEFEVTQGQQEILNPKGVNAIRAFPGRGRRVWGARTISADPLWKYVNVRRLFIFLEASIFRGTQWVVFEPNNERLWARVKQTITGFLRTQWREGALLGAKEEEAFFVKCDRTTMTDDDLFNGRLIVVIGVAPVRPAEFVIFRIAQLTSSATSIPQ